MRKKASESRANAGPPGLGRFQWPPAGVCVLLLGVGGRRQRGEEMQRVEVKAHGIRGVCGKARPGNVVRSRDSRPSSPSPDMRMIQRVYGANHHPVGK